MYLKYKLAIIAFFSTLVLSAQTTNNWWEANGLQNAHIGISIYNTSTNNYLQQYQSNKFFIPASNVKIATCFAAMQYIGKQLTAAQYAETPTAIYLHGTADPSFLHKKFKQQPLQTFIEQANKPIYLTNYLFKTNPWGYGWGWSDYQDDYMAERSSLPIAGNTANFYLNNNNQLVCQTALFENMVKPLGNKTSTGFSISRSLNNNLFEYKKGNKQNLSIPFCTFSNNSTKNLNITSAILTSCLDKQIMSAKEADVSSLNFKTVEGISTDSVLKEMMYESDNFIAEHLLLQACYKQLGYMQEDSIIAKTMATLGFTGSYKPNWVDGSGLSRYNLFTPNMMVNILQQLENKFGINRLKQIFPHGGVGTLKLLYNNYSKNIYAKTGTLSNNVALSGYLISKRGQLLIFSIMVNNHNLSASVVRKKIEEYLINIINQN